MDKEYKKFVVRSLYGLLDGSPKYLEGLMQDMFPKRFKIEFDELYIESTDRYILESSEVGMKGCWIGSMTATLVVDGETFSYTRDWGEEHDIDVLHPDLESDLWFYESEKCCASRKSDTAYKMIELGKI